MNRVYVYYVWVMGALECKDHGDPPADESRHDGIRHDESRHDGIRHDGIRHDGIRHDESRHDGTMDVVRVFANRVAEYGAALYSDIRRTRSSASIRIPSDAIHADCETLQRRFQNLFAPDFDVTCTRTDGGYVFRVTIPTKTTS